MKAYEMKEYKDVLYFKYLEMADSEALAEQQAAAVKRALSKPGITKFLNDNSAINAVASPEVNAVWGELMKWIGSTIDKNATIAPNVTHKMQINRLSKSSGTYDSIRAFTSLEESLKFMDIPDFKL